MPSSKLQPAVMGGLVIGILSALPLISIGNICCCLWIVSGGALAAYLLQANQATPITTGDGAVTGLMAGVIGSVVYSVVAIPVSIVMGPIQAKFAEGLLRNAGELPEGLEPMLEAARNSGFSILGAIAGFFLMLILSVIFASIGGIIGAVIFKKKLPPTPPGPPPIPPYGA